MMRSETLFGGAKSLVSKWKGIKLPFGKRRVQFNGAVGNADKPDMKNLRIGQTIYLLLGFALFAGACFSGFLIYRCGSVNAQYTRVIRGEIAQAQRVRVLQVTFKKQVQAWKDILVRGKDDAALAKYTNEFHAQGAQVQTLGKALVGDVKDPEAKDSLTRFLQAYETLN